MYGGRRGALSGLGSSTCVRFVRFVSQSKRGRWLREREGENKKNTVVRGVVDL